MVATATVLLLGVLGAPAVAATLSPLPESDYSVSHACAAPRPGYASCLALVLRPQTAAARSFGRPIGVTRQVPSASPGSEVCKPPTAAEGCYGLRPIDLQAAYFHGEPPTAPAGEPQTIALIDAYNDYEAMTELTRFDEEFGLPTLPACIASEPTATEECFEQVNERGETATSALPFPKAASELEATEARCTTPRAEEAEAEAEEREEACETALEVDGWGIEMATDIEVARGICHNCRILLVEAANAGDQALEAAEVTAERLGATEISNSWGGEPPGFDGSAFNHQGTVITASAGDTGYRKWTEAADVEHERAECREFGIAASRCEEFVPYYSAGAEYPASSPHVIAVGGTKLTLEAGSTLASEKRKRETVWNEDPGPRGEVLGAGGGGCSTSFAAPLWQQAVSDWPAVGCGGYRAVSDVAAVADPVTGVAVYDSMPNLEEVEPGRFSSEPLHWWPIGGTSVASPIVASMFALAGGAHGAPYPARTLYSHLGDPSLYDVEQGGNGSCDGYYGSGCSGSLSSPFDCGNGALICTATHGYDGPTGVGAPNGLAGFERAAANEQRLAEAEAAVPAREQRLAEEAQARQEAEHRAEHEAQSRAAKLSEELVRQEALQRVAAEHELALEKAASEASVLLKRGSELEAALKRLEEEASAKQRGTATRAHATVLSLSLTRHAKKLLARNGARLGQVAFSFKLSGEAKLLATLQRRTKVHGHWRWRTIHGAKLRFRARRPRGTRHFKSSRKLAPGRYRLVLRALNGGQRRISISIR